MPTYDAHLNAAAFKRSNQFVFSMFKNKLINNFMTI